MVFRVGQKIICINASPFAFGWPNPWAVGEELTDGTIYTVLAVDGDAIQIMEIKRPFRWGYAASRFRPIVERKTDISIFTRMLTPKKVGADA